MLLRSGFELEKKRGKGSHTIWNPLYEGSITLSGKDSQRLLRPKRTEPALTVGKDAQPDREKDVKQAIKQVKDNEA